ncbi:MAG: hypothetical protein QG587_1092 [Chloroflexota bacterium]|nr:hypothetical protein [Chloroflexota bacterium]
MTADTDACCASCGELVHRALATCGDPWCEGHAAGKAAGRTIGRRDAEAWLRREGYSGLAILLSVWSARNP